MRIFGPFASPSTSAVTDAEPRAVASEVTASPSTSNNGVKLMLEPTTPSKRSTSRTSPTATLCWRPPLRTIAYTPDLLSLVADWVVYDTKLEDYEGFEGTHKRAPKRAHRGSRVRGRS